MWDASSVRRPMYTAIVAAMLIVTGLPFLFMHEAGPGFDGFVEMGFRLLLGLPVLALAIVVMLMIVHVVLRRIVSVRTAGRVVLATGVVAFCVMLAVGWHLARPRVRLNGMAGTPSLATIRDVKAKAVTSFGDGQAWLFSFAINEEEFERWTGELRLEPWPEAAADEERALQPDEWISRHFPDLYERPRGAQRYRRGPLTVIASPDRSVVYVYVDRWRRRS